MKTLHNQQKIAGSHPMILEGAGGKSESAPGFGLQSSGGFGSTTLQMNPAKEKEEMRKKEFKKGIDIEECQERRAEMTRKNIRKARSERLAKKRAEASIRLELEENPGLMEEDSEDSSSESFEPISEDFDPDITPYFDSYNGKSLPLESKAKGEYFEAATRGAYEMDGLNYVDLNEFKPNCPGLDHLADGPLPFEQDKAHTSGDMDTMVSAFNGEIEGRNGHATKFLKGFKNPDQKTYKSMMAALQHASGSFENPEVINGVMESIEAMHEQNANPEANYVEYPHENEELVETIGSNMSFSVPYDVWEEMGVRTGSIKEDIQFLKASAKDEGGDPESFLKSYNEKHPDEEGRENPFHFAVPSELNSWEINERMEELIAEGKIRKAKKRTKKDKSEEEWLPPND